MLHRHSSHLQVMQESTGRMEFQGRTTTMEVTRTIISRWITPLTTQASEDPIRSLHIITVIATLRMSAVDQATSLLQVRTTSLKTSSSTWTRETRRHSISSRISSRLRIQRIRVDLPIPKIRVHLALHRMKVQAAVASAGTVMPTITLNQTVTVTAIIPGVTMEIFTIKACCLKRLLLSKLPMSKSSSVAAWKILPAKIISLRWQSSSLSFLACPSSFSKLPRTSWMGFQWTPYLVAQPHLPSIWCDMVQICILVSKVRVKVFISNEPWVPDGTRAKSKAHLSSTNPLCIVFEIIFIYLTVLIYY